MKGTLLLFYQLLTRTILKEECFLVKASFFWLCHLVTNTTKKAQKTVLRAAQAGGWGTNCSGLAICFDILVILGYISFMFRLFRWLFFNLKYFGSPPWDTGITPPELEAFIAEHAPGNALDLGCGTGTNLLALARAGWQVTGVDFALRAVLEARRKMRRAGYPALVSVGDVTRFEPETGPFDLILDIGCYHGIAVGGREAYRQNLGANLKPGGYFLLYGHISPAGNAGGVGMREEEIGLFAQRLALLKRDDSLDRWERQAVWLTFQKESE
jgi:SAM-dependent methyltransferase